jgi:hypothetical protein
MQIPSDLEAPERKIWQYAVKRQRLNIAAIDLLHAALQLHQYIRRVRTIIEQQNCYTENGLRGGLQPHRAVKATSQLLNTYTLVLSRLRVLDNPYVEVDEEVD